MGTEDIKIHPGQLQTQSLTAKTGASNTKSLSNDMGTAISDLVSSMNAVPLLSSASGALETFSTGLMATLECFALGMTVIDQGLSIAAKDFKSLDGKLASSFSALESQLGYYTGYGTTFTMPTVQAMPVSLTAHTLSFSAPHSSGFWGSVGGFFSHHWKEIAAGALIVGGVALTVFTAGGSDVAADSAAAALLADSAATAATEGTAVTATQSMYALAA